MSWAGGKPLEETRSGHYTAVASEEKDIVTEPNLSSIQVQSLRSLRLLLRLSISLLCIAVVAIGFLLFARSNDQVEPHTNSTSSLVRTPVPPIPLTAITFRKAPEFETSPSPESDRAWNSLLPDGRGYIYLANGTDYGLERGELTPWGEIYSVSLFHQLHCLGQIRKFYFMLLKGIVHKDDKINHVAEALNGDGGEHVHHCYDYLRQSIMCNGDMALEWPRTEPDGTRNAVDGWDAVHECKDWDTVWSYMTKVGFNHSARHDLAG